MRFEFSGALYRFANYNREVEAQGSTLGECLDNLIEQYPPLGTTMLDAAGQVSGSHRLFLNGEQVMVEEGADVRATPIGNSDVVYVLTAITGG